MYGRDTETIVEMVQSELGNELGAPSEALIRRQVAGARARMDEYRDGANEALRVRQIARLETGAVQASQQQDFHSLAHVEKTLSDIAGTRAPERLEVKVQEGTLEGEALLARFLATQGQVARARENAPKLVLEAVVIEGESVTTVTEGGGEEA